MAIEPAVFGAALIALFAYSTELLVKVKFNTSLVVGSCDLFGIFVVFKRLGRYE